MTTRSSRRSRFAVAAAGVTLGAVALAGCGSDDAPGGAASPTPTPSVVKTPHGPVSVPTDTGSDLSGTAFETQAAVKVRNQAVAATIGAGSFRIRGRFTTDGKHEAIDLRIDAAGDCTGTFSIGAGTAEVLGVGGTYWFRPDAVFWKGAVGSQASRVIAQVGDQWVDNADLADVCNLGAFFDDTKDSDSTRSKGKSVEIGGRRTVAVVTSGDAGRATGYVLTQAPHYVVKLVRTGRNRALMALGGFGIPFTVTAPAPDDQIDLDSVG